MAERRSLQGVGVEYENDLVYSLTLRKVFCDVDETRDNRLLWTTQIDRSVLYGTVPALIEHLTPSLQHIEIDHSYRLCFLAVYRTFISPEELQSSLLERYVTVDTTVNGENCQNKLKILKSLLSFIKLWLDKYTSDFIDNQTLLTNLEDFLTTHSNPQLSDTITELHTSISTLKTSINTTASNGTCTNGDRCSTTSPDKCCHPNCRYQCIAPSSGRSYKLFDKTPYQVARDLTAYDADIFKRVIPHQCLYYIRGKRTKAPTVLKAINTFNTIVSQVITTILQATNSKGIKSNSARGKRISHWIDVATSCRILKNFSSLIAIVSGLRSSSIHRLGRSWSTVSSDRKSILKELDDLLSSDSNFQTFRDVLDKEATGKRLLQNKQSIESIQGVVPYLGTILTDLTMLHTAIPDVNKEGLVNFDKRRKEFEICSKLSLFQTTASKYVLPLDTSLIHWLHTSLLLTEKESFDVSIELETSSSLSCCSTPSPKSSPSHLSSLTISPPSPPSQYLLRKSLQLLTVAVHDVSALTKLSPTTTNSTSTSNSGSTSSGGIIRSNSSHDISSNSIIVKISVDKDDYCCNYKSIMINKSDRTESVIDKVLEKFDLPGSYSSYQLFQCIPDQKDILIPHQAVVYYAIITSHKETPILILKIKK